MRFHLVDDWHRIARKAWSVKFALLAGVLSAIEVVVTLLTPQNPTPWFAAGAALLCLAAAVARITAQPGMWK